DGDRQLSRMMPDRRSGGDHEDAALVAIPIGHAQSRPAGLLVLEGLAELLQAAALLSRAASSSASARRRLEQIGVEAQPRHDANVAAQRSDEIESGEAGVGDDDDLALSQ